MFRLKVKERARQTLLLGLWPIAFQLQPSKALCDGLCKVDYHAWLPAPFALSWNYLAGYQLTPPQTLILKKIMSRTPTDQLKHASHWG